MISSLVWAGFITLIFWAVKMERAGIRRTRLDKAKLQLEFARIDRRFNGAYKKQFRRGKLVRMVKR